MWSWLPVGAARPSGWGRPTDVRLRRHTGWGEVMVVPDSFGAVVLVGADGGVRWSVDVGPMANPHAAELVHGDQLVVAASTAGEVLTFDTRNGAAWVTLALEGAHGLAWDQGREVLWALGTHELLELRHAPGTPREWQRSATVPLPEPGGHDVAPTADGGGLWVTTESHVHRFDGVARQWVADELLTRLDRPRVKSIDEDPVSRMVTLTVPDPDRVPDWLASQVTLLDRSALPSATHIYKARHWRIPA